MNVDAGSTQGQSRWKRVAAGLAILVGGLLGFLAFGLEISSSDGLTPGGIVVFIAMLVAGASLVIWGVAQFRT